MEEEEAVIPMKIKETLLNRAIVLLLEFFVSVFETGVVEINTREASCGRVSLHFQFLCF